MTIFFKHFSSSVASPPLHRFVPANLSPPPFLHSTFLNVKLSVFSTSIAADADADAPNNHHPPLAENTHAQLQNPIPQFLLNECGLSQPQLSTVLRRSAFLLKTRSAETARQAVQVLRESGFTEDQVRAIIIKTPCFLAAKADRQLKPKIELFKTLGLTGKDLVAICKVHRMLNSSLQNCLIPRVEYLQNLFVSKDILTMALKTTPSLLQIELERRMKPNVDFLKQSGIEGELLLFFLSRCPKILSQSTSSLKVRMEYARNMGIPQSSKKFAYALLVLLNNSPENLKKKLELLASFGLLEHEIKELFRNYPAVLNTSIDKMQKSMDFLIHTAGLPANIIVKYPMIVNYSLETRIKPRHAVFKFLSALELYKPTHSLLSMIAMTEKMFLDKYMKDGPYATRLLEIYRGKSVDLDIIQSPLLQG